MIQDLELIKKEIKYDKTLNCVQCGYCLPVCPTYITMGKETHSPRGRINLVKMVGEGKMTDLSIMEEPMDLCLGCRACETACPTGVQYGEILEGARSVLKKSKKSPMLQTILLNKVIPSHKMMEQAGNAFWLYEKSGMQTILRKSGLLDKLPAHLGTFESIIPAAVSPKERARFPKRVQMESPGIMAQTGTDQNGEKREKKYTVAFFTGCIMDAMFRRINQLSVELLAKAGCEVVMMENQTCCGALHAHTGDMKESKKLAKQNIAAFEKENVDFIVNNAGGCGAMLKEYDRLLEDEPEWLERAKEFAGKNKDISEVLILCGGIPVINHPPEKVTYQRSCHMTNVQKVKIEPVQLIKSIPNVELIEMNEGDMCCGSAGIYNIVNYETSMEILDRKMWNVKDTLATTILTTNPGCLLQMKLGVKREGLTQKVRVLHLVEFLAEAAGISS
ncbi:(Fe-S)-binding protein [Neobacillus mesonae]|uniref:(Fe-S)-binding protein n=1 Tax=Neobacillus mesonae TaxID=1193713 RepID=UPI002E249735|nr:(Fe-S)-binding protein [Neobacillus mesonae]